jgi:hypothetical protein
MDTIITQLKKLEDLVFERESSFIVRFVMEDPLLGLNGIWFGAENIKFYFVTYEGTHITNQITWEEFNNWLEGK